MTTKMNQLGAALDKQSYEWLLEANEDIAAAVAAEVVAGVSPDAIRRFVLAHAGADRHGLADRCQSAARFLHGVSAQRG